MTSRPETSPRDGEHAGRWGAAELPRLYTDLASWWPLLSAPEEYAEEAEFYRRTLFEAAGDAPRSMLELGSGGGNNASHMKAHVSLTLVDRSPGMLAVSRALNPDCEHVEGDMRNIRLHRRFDRVFVHDAITYVTTVEDLRCVFETAYVHCRPGGAALFAPDEVSEIFRPSTSHGGHDGGDRSLRYLEWSWDPDPTDSTYLVDYAYLLRDRDGSTAVEKDRHLCGLFPRAEWLESLSRAGFRPRVVPLEHSELEPGECEVFVAQKPANDVDAGTREAPE